MRQEQSLSERQAEYNATGMTPGGSMTPGGGHTAAVRVPGT